MISNNFKKKLKIKFFKIIKKSLEILSKIIFHKFLNRILTKVNFIEFFLEREDYNYISQHSDTEWIIKKLNQEGFCIIKDFWSEDECFNAINDIDNLLIDYPEYIQSKNKSDYRVYGAERYQQY